MALINPTLPTLGQPNATEDQDIINAFTAIIAAINGGLNEANISSSASLTASQLAEAVQAAAGLNDPLSALRRRGKSIVTTEESRTNTAYGLLATPDRVSNIVLPTDGLIAIAYQAQWKESVSTGGRATIFLHNGTTDSQVKVAYGSGAPVTTAARMAGATPAVDTYAPLTTYAAGLASAAPAGGGAAVATGQVVGAIVGQAKVILNDGGAVDEQGYVMGGPLYVFAAAGTYTVSVQFKATSGSVTVKERKLWVSSQGFD